MGSRRKKHWQPGRLALDPTSGRSLSYRKRAQLVAVLHATALANQHPGAEDGPGAPTGSVYRLYQCLPLTLDYTHVGTIRAFAYHVQDLVDAGLIVRTVRFMGRGGCVGYLRVTPSGQEAVVKYPLEAMQDGRGTLARYLQVQEAIRKTQKTMRALRKKERRVQKTLARFYDKVPNRVPRHPTVARDYGTTRECLSCKRGQHCASHNPTRKTLEKRKRAQQTNGGSRLAEG